MPENEQQQHQGGETPPQAGQSSTPPPAPETGPDGKPFDAARAMSTIEALRAEIKGLKGTQKERDELAAKLREIEDANKSEAERAVQKAAEAEQKLSQAEGRLRGMAIRVAVAESATAAGISPENVKAALRLLDQDAIELDDDGQPKNVEQALKALVKEFPLLAGTTGNGGARSTPPTPKPSGQQPTRAERVEQAEKELAASGRYRL